MQTVWLVFINMNVWTLCVFNILFLIRSIRGAHFYIVLRKEMKEVYNSTTLPLHMKLDYMNDVPKRIDEFDKRLI